MGFMDATVLVVGAGPVGLTAGLALHRAGIAVRVLEKRPGLTAASRASTFHPSSLAVLDRLGVAGGLIAQGRRVDALAWLTAGRGADAVMPMRHLARRTRFPFRLHAEQSMLTPLLHDALPPGTVRFGTAAVSVAQDDEGVTVVTEDGARHRAAFVIAADGARSTLREAAGISVETAPYGHRVLRLMTPLPLDEHVPGLAPAGIAYVHDGPDSISLLAMPGLWRIIIRVPASVGDDEALSPGFRAPILRRFLPGLPDPLPLASSDVYGVARGIAARMRQGRILVIGDAAHVTNTRGGMNMNAGLHDAATLAATLAAVLRGGDAALLDSWEQARLRVTAEVLLARTDRAVASASAWRDEAVAAAAEPARAEAWLMAASMLDTCDAGATP
jgi:2-polyprenyl-6-methoxyphenol hydroxylase-like FAD-dependent oxidoreductase